LDSLFCDPVNGLFSLSSHPAWSTDSSLSHDTLLFRQTEVTLPPNTVDFSVGSTGLTLKTPIFISDERNENTDLASSDDNDDDPAVQQPPVLVQQPPVLIQQPTNFEESSEDLESSPEEAEVTTTRKSTRTRKPIDRIDLNPKPGGDRNWHTSDENSAAAVLPATATVAFSAMETLASLVIDDHIRDAIPFQSAASTTLAITSSAQHNYLTRRIVGLSLSAAFLLAVYPAGGPTTKRSRSGQCIWFYSRIVTISCFSSCRFKFTCINVSTTAYDRKTSC
jgi:hypothetical protein